MADEALIAGADGCPSGWILAVLDGGAVRLEHVATGGLGAWVTRLAVLAIDVPFGLPDKGSRACDVAARRQLPGAGSRVFPAPRRPMLGAGSAHPPNPYLIWIMNAREAVLASQGPPPGRRQGASRKARSELGAARGHLPVPHRLQPPPRLPLRPRPAP